MEFFGEETGKFIGSVTSRKYYFPWCYSAEIIKRENRIIFKSREEAEKFGYQKAKNCKGL